MKALSKIIVLLAVLALAGCGGGGGGSQSAFTPTPADTIIIDAAATSITTNSFTTLTVTVKKADGSPENDGITVNASLSPSTIGTVSGATGQPAGTTASNTIAGGKTTFNFTSSNQAGTATITISVPAGTNGATTAATKSIGIAVTQGSTIDPRLDLSPTAVTLPLNPYAGIAEVGPAFVSNYIGSPYVAEITLTWRHSNGQLVTGTSTVNVSIDPVQIAGFSELDDPATKQQDPTKPDGNEFLTILGSGPVNVTGGNGVIFIHAGDTPGTATLTVTAIDPDNNQTISSQLQVTVAGTASSLPASISTDSTGFAYITGSNGPQSAYVNATVRDGNFALVPDPDGFDNVHFEITGPANSDARLSGVDASGQPVTGSALNTVTHNGVASVSLLSGTQQGPVQITATADRGDNNVDNTIQDGVSATSTVVLSDGKLFNLTLTQPGPNAGSLLINGVSGDASSSSVPADVNGTYSLTISAQGQDRQGNPVVPGTAIKFGEIDGPLNPYTGTNRGYFSIAGGDGNPAEGGTLFTAPTGTFTTAGGGAGPGDSVLVFGKDVTGNRDLENARTVQRINNAGSLNATIAFNRNDDTGVSVDYGAVLPYIIGRGVDGNITPAALTNDVGVATVQLTYPVSKLGKLAAVWAQGNGIATGGATKTVDDIMLVRFAGVAAIGDLTAAISASPNPIYGNTTQEVTVCVADALGSPLQGIQFSFQYTGTGTAKVDGTTGAGLVGSLTDGSGCAVATVVTSGVAPSSDTGGGGMLQFCLGSDLCATVDVVVNVASLQVNPASVSVGADPKTVNITITALDTLGNKTPGVTITGACSASGGAGATIQPSSFTGTTGTNGSVVDTVTASNFIQAGNPPQVGSGQCTFSATGVASATVNFNGLASCSDFSPSTCN